MLVKRTNNGKTRSGSKTNHAMYYRGHRVASDLALSRGREIGKTTIKGRRIIIGAGIPVRIKSNGSDPSNVSEEDE